MARITQNVMKRISGRSRIGSPASVCSGIASAAASETAPRMPIHAMSAVSRSGGGPDLSGKNFANVNTQTIRTTITVRLASAP